MPFQNCGILWNQGNHQYGILLAGLMDFSANQEVDLGAPSDATNLLINDFLFLQASHSFFSKIQITIII